MAWRILLIQNPAKLTIDKGQLALDNQDGHFTLPMEDIIAIILETPQASLTSKLLAESQSFGIVWITCDANHMPNGTLLPFLPHSRAGQIAHIQQEWSAAFRKRLWQRIVKTKILNQADCLSLTKGTDAAKKLRAISQRVMSGDPNNVEAQAAREYWTQLFGKDFRRGHSDTINAALNYGYAVVRALVARAQVTYGLIPAFGIHHDNDLNSFNLTDDVMEVFRPFVDLVVYEMQVEGSLSQETLSKENRQRLAAIGQVKCILNDEIHTIAHATEVLAASVVEAIRTKNHEAFPCPAHVFPERTPPSL